MKEPLELAVVEIVVAPPPALCHCVSVGCGVSSRKWIGFEAESAELSSCAAVNRLMLSRNCCCQGLRLLLNVVGL